MKSIAIWALFVLAIGSKAFAADTPIDYQTLDFSLALTKLRAGNHDASGTNQYYFQTKMYGLPVLKEEVKKPFAERKKEETDLGKFASLTIDSLKYWVPEKKPGDTLMTVKGDRIRSLVADIMRNHTVPEAETSVICVITMYEMNKKFGWLGEDTKVGETSFDIIRDSLPHGAKVENKNLSITDSQGTFVEIKLEYNSLKPKDQNKP